MPRVANEDRGFQEASYDVRGRSARLLRPGANGYSSSTAIILVPLWMAAVCPIEIKDEQNSGEKQASKQPRHISTCSRRPASRFREASQALREKTATRNRASSKSISETRLDSHSSVSSWRRSTAPCWNTITTSSIPPSRRRPPYLPRSSQLNNKKG